MKKIKMKFFAKVMIILALLSLIPLLFLGQRLININRITLKRMVMEQHISTAENLADKLDKYFENLSKSIIFITQTQGLNTVPEYSRAQMLKALLSSSKNIETIAVVSPAGEEQMKLYNAKLIETPFYVDRSKETEFKIALAGVPAVGRVGGRGLLQ